MKGEVLNYFVNLKESKTLPTSKGAIYFNGLSDDVTITSDPNEKNIAIMNINKKKFYSKPFYESEGIAGIAASKMYNDIGILTPPYYLMKQEDTFWKVPELRLISQDVLKLDQFFAQLGGYALRRQNFLDYNLRNDANKWLVLFDPELQKIFLEKMTAECLNELIGIFLVDEIRTDVDRHPDNYFLCKDKNSLKFEHVIPIDLDYSQILKDSFRENESFESVISKPYFSYTPQIGHDNESYKDRVVDIMRHIHRGNFAKVNIDLLKSALSYDLPKEVKSVCKEYRDLRKYKKQAYDRTAELWEYNRETIGKELGM